MKKTQQKRRGGKTQKRRGGKTQKRRGEMKRKVMRGGALTSTHKYVNDFELFEQEPDVINGSIKIYRDLKTNEIIDNFGTKISDGEEYSGYGYFNSENMYVYFPVSEGGIITDGGKKYSNSLIKCLKQFTTDNYKLKTQLIIAYNQLKHKYQIIGDPKRNLLQYLYREIQNLTNIEEHGSMRTSSVTHKAFKVDKPPVSKSKSVRPLTQFKTSKSTAPEPPQQNP